MTNGNCEYIDFSSYPNLKDVVEESFINGKNFHIRLKKPTNAKIIVTIKQEYSPFRKEIENRLKEKEVDKQDIKNILGLVDNSHEVIYKDAAVATNTIANDLKKENPESDQSDQSDPRKKEIVSVS
jgi:phosphotransferase system HPr-like phosphotransfer protein